MRRIWTYAGLEERARGETQNPPDRLSHDGEAPQHLGPELRFPVLLPLIAGVDQDSRGSTFPPPNVDGAGARRTVLATNGVGTVYEPEPTRVRPLEADSKAPGQEGRVELMGTVWSSLPTEGIRPLQGTGERRGGGVPKG